MERSNPSIILSIHPRHSDNILQGKKSVELRKVRPKGLTKDTVILMYVSSPIKALVGVFWVSNLIQKRIPDLWLDVSNHACISYDEFTNYYSEKEKGLGIFIEKYWKFPYSIKLQEMRKRIDFHPPQSFRYTTKDDIQVLEYFNIMGTITQYSSLHHPSGGKF
jgi:predicted transcriptional regulator